MSTVLRWLVLLVGLVGILAIAAWVFPGFRDLLAIAGMAVIAVFLIWNWFSN